mmetsp:Transcript_7651/g.11362  ORF Transcript_7651/g.11362 Transcript_7651/m.11362 type:complete len:459 (+) Transcript_7651:32-1408(+)
MASKNKKKRDKRYNEGLNMIKELPHIIDFHYVKFPIPHHSKNTKGRTSDEKTRIKVEKKMEKEMSKEMKKAMRKFDRFNERSKLWFVHIPKMKNSTFNEFRDAIMESQENKEVTKKMEVKMEDDVENKETTTTKPQQQPKKPWMVVQPEGIQQVRALAQRQCQIQIETQQKRLNELKKKYKKDIIVHAKNKEALLDKLSKQRQQLFRIEKLKSTLEEIQRKEREKKERERLDEIARKKEEEEAKHRAFMNAPIPKKVKTESNTPKTPRGTTPINNHHNNNTNTNNPIKGNTKLGRRLNTPTSSSTTPTTKMRLNPHVQPRPNQQPRPSPYNPGSSTTPLSAKHSPFSAGVATSGYAPSAATSNRPSTPPSSSLSAHFPTSSKQKSDSTPTPTSANKKKFFAGRRPNYQVGSSSGGSSFSYSPGSAMNANANRPSIWTNRYQNRPHYNNNVSNPQNRRK